MILTLSFILLLTILIVAMIGYINANRMASASYSRQIQAQEVAQGGLQDILHDIHSEIVAGSVPDPNGSTYTQGTGTYATVYIPTTNLTAEPARIGYANSSYSTNTSATTLSPTLIRVSRATGNGGDTFFTALPTYFSNVSAVSGGNILNRASNVPTTNSAVDGRYISMARWNRTYLLAAYAANIPTPFSNAPPDWVYVTRTGSRVCTTAEVTSGALAASQSIAKDFGAVVPGSNPPASPVVGRYAFVMYDEGALLDINVAGYTSTSTNMSTIPATNNPAGVSQAVYGKSYAAYADLTQLPGFAAANLFSQPKQAQIDALVNWRNASAAASAGAAITGPNYLSAVYNNAQQGFLSFQTSSSGVSDSPFVSRKDLINYFTSIDSNINKSSATLSLALPYLGTFSRSLNWPSWRPTADSTNIVGYYTGTYGTNVLATSSTHQLPINNRTPPVSFPTANVNAVSYKSNAESTSTTIANRDLANVRFNNAGSVMHYDDSGNTTSYSVDVGSPMLQHRFSLAKLGWFNNVNPRSGAGSSASAQAIQACFGLKWGSDVYGNPCWMYVGSSVDSSGNMTGSSVQTGIKTLAQVAAESNPREPNFFELLKAGILSGSLGKDPGPWVQYSTFGIAQTYQPYATKVGGTGIANGQNLYNATEGVIGLNYDAYMKSQDMHVLQIGANIMDQYDSDSYPTAIYMQAFSGETSATPELGPINVVYGVENLPYLTRIYNIAWHTDAVGGYADGLNAWFQPELWNPFQAPATARTTPTKFRVRAYGQSYLNWSQTFDYPFPTGYGDANAKSWTTGQTSSVINFDADPVDAFIYFTDTGATPGFYNGVTRLARSNVDTSLTAPINLYPTTPKYTYTSGSTTQFAAIHGGWCAYIPMYPPDVGGTAPNYTAPSATTVVDRQYDVFYNSDGTTYNNYNWIPNYLMPNPMVTFCVQYSPDGGNTWLPYNYMSRVQVYSSNEFDSNQEPGATGYSPRTSVPVASAVHGTPSSGDMYTRPDPVTDRFSAAYVEPGHGADPYQDKANVGSTFQHSSGTSVTTIANSPLAPGLSVDRGMPMRSAGFTYHNIDPKTTGGGGGLSAASYDSFGEMWPPNAQSTGYQGIYLGCWDQNVPHPSGTSQMDAYYADADGVIRPGDGCLRNTSTGDGCSQLLGAYSKTDPSANTTLVGRRPIILNRPFRSVAELGYAKRDLPFKTLDFFTASSGDSALLDLFTLTDEPTVVAGQVNLSNAPTPVIQALLNGGNKQELDPTYNLSSESKTMAVSMVGALSPTGAAPNPLNNRADLVNRFGISINTGTSAVTGTIYSGFSASADKADKTYMEAPIRALSGATNTRTWNLLIDIIAQSGRLSPSAKTLSDFVVEGERRYWLHVAIDRYTGKIIDQQLETIYE